MLGSRASLTIGLLSTCVLLASCGSAHPRDELLAAAARSVPADASASTSSSGTGATTAAGSGSAPGTASGASPAAAASGGAQAAGQPDPAAVPTAGGDPDAPPVGELQLIRVGTIGFNSGIGGAATRGGLAAIRAWEQWVNANGGVAGHQVEVLTADDAGDPAQSRAARQRLVDEEGVVAFVGNTDVLTGGNFLDFHAQTRVPVVGGIGASYYYDSPFYFPPNSYAPARFTATLAAVADQIPAGARVATIVCVEDRATCTDAGQTWNAEAGRFNLQVVYQAQVSIAQPDYTGECISARNAGADVVMLAMDSAGTERLARSCARQGFRPRFAGLIGSDALASVGELDGFIFASPSFPWTDTSVPARAAFADAMATYAPGENLDVNATSVWTSAVLFTRAIESLGPQAQITNEDVLRGLWSLRGDDLGGLTFPLTFTEGQAATPQVCYFPMSISGGQWSATGPSGITCR